MESHSKTCTKCKETKPRGEFSKSRKVKDGLQSQCKACRRQYNKQYYQENREQVLERQKQYYQENREQVLEYNKQYYQENREQVLEYNKQYYQENREQRAEYDKQYYQENREQVLERQKQWAKDNPEKRAANSAKYRALKQDGIPEPLRDCPIEKDRLEQIYKLRDLLTKATGIQYHVDHIWPLSKGGPHWSGNLQIITAEENLSKHDTLCEDTARVIEESLDEHLSSRQ